MRELTLGVLSIENFARYNERLGHKHGDEVLRSVAGTIRQAVRNRDVIGRCFGSTFAVMFPGTTFAEAAPMADSILAKLAEASYIGQEALPEGGIRFLGGLEEYQRGEGWAAEDFFSVVNEKSKTGSA